MNDIFEYINNRDFIKIIKYIKTSDTMDDVHKGRKILLSILSMMKKLPFIFYDVFVVDEKKIINHIQQILIFINQNKQYNIEYFNHFDDEDVNILINLHKLEGDDQIYKYDLYILKSTDLFVNKIVKNNLNYSLKDLYKYCIKYQQILNKLFGYNIYQIVYLVYLKNVQISTLNISLKNYYALYEYYDQQVNNEYNELYEMLLKNKIDRRVIINILQTLNIIKINYGIKNINIEDKLNFLLSTSNLPTLTYIQHNYQ